MEAKVPSHFLTLWHTLLDGPLVCCSNFANFEAPAACSARDTWTPSWPVYAFSSALSTCAKLSKLWQDQQYAAGLLFWLSTVLGQTRFELSRHPFKICMTHPAAHCCSASSQTSCTCKLALPASHARDCWIKPQIRLPTLSETKWLETFASRYITTEFR